MILMMILDMRMNQVQSIMSNKDANESKTSTSESHNPIETRRAEDTSHMKDIVIIEDTSNYSSLSTNESTSSTSTNFESITTNVTEIMNGDIDYQ
jgi:hypothetical protein